MRSEMPRPMKTLGAIMMLLGGPTCTVALAAHQTNAALLGIAVAFVGMLLFAAARLGADH